MQNLIHTGDALPEKTGQYAEFWAWFQQHQQDFFQIVQSNTEVRTEFLDKVSDKTEAIKTGIYILTGMYDAQTAELIFTADSNPANIVFVEELLQTAPQLKLWRFTCFKPAMDIDNVAINMDHYRFDKDNLSFYDNQPEGYPDEIDITVIYKEYTQAAHKEIQNGVYIFLDNYLGELNFVENIDRLTVAGAAPGKNLIPIEKLKSYLRWRQKEFIEKYEGRRHDSSADNYVMLEATLPNGHPMIAVINTDLLGWDAKASHPWICILIIKYKGESANGLPSEKDYNLMESIEEKLMTALKDSQGYLNIGRQTAENEREVYFACKDFRKPSKLFYAVQQEYRSQFHIDYEIFKDKYWRCLKRFETNAPSDNSE